MINNIPVAIKQNEQKIENMKKDIIIYTKHNEKLKKDLKLFENDN